MIPFSFLLHLFSNWQRYAVYTLIAVALGMTVWMHGLFTGRQELIEYKGKQATESLRIIKQIVQLAGKVREFWHVGETRYVTQFVEIEKESADVPVRPSCNATAGWVRSHNAAASADSSSIGDVADASDSGVTEAAALATVRQNYRFYHQVANDLQACRAFVNGLPEATQ